MSLLTSPTLKLYWRVSFDFFLPDVQIRFNHTLKKDSISSSFFNNFKGNDEFLANYRCDEEKLTLRARGFSSLVCKVFIAAWLLLCFSFVCPQHVYCLYLWRCCAVNLEVAQDVLFWKLTRCSLSYCCLTSCQAWSSLWGKETWRCFKNPNNLTQH